LRFHGHQERPRRREDQRAGHRRRDSDAARCTSAQARARSRRRRMILRSRNVLGHGAATIHIDGERVARIGDYDDVDESLIDYGDLVLMPGVVDSHVHVNEPGRTEWEGFDTATRAAAAGGVTTIVDMPLNSIPPTTSVAALMTKAEAMSGKCRVDV